jgi:hypothetical protein
MHGASVRVVGLKEGKAGTWHFERRVIRGGSQQSAGEGGFAGAQWTRQQDGIAGTYCGGNLGSETFGGGKIGQRQHHRCHSAASLVRTQT